MASFFYTLVVYPITQIIELTYMGLDNTFNIHGISIIGVSLAITILTLPLYATAERLQESERLKKSSLDKGVTRIKAAFRGDERYMVLSTFYRQNHYHPIMALRGLAPLAIQIPFFIAAYQFLSRPIILDGATFLFIKDLSKPDGLLKLGNKCINLLPIIMTIINIIASVIYTSGQFNIKSLKNTDSLNKNNSQFSIFQKLQLHLVALVFLLLLYKSPSGLVLYWTCNNIFSLVKNIYYKFKQPVWAFFYTAVVAFFLVDIYFLVAGVALEKSGYLIALSIALPMIPSIMHALHSLLKDRNISLSRAPASRHALFFLSVTLFVLLTSLVQPAAVISSSAQEFSFIDKYTTPLFFLANAFLQGVGAFFLWPLLIYLLSSRRNQSFISIAVFIMAAGALINVFIFKGDYGSLSSSLVFDGDGGLHNSIGSILACDMVMVAIVFGTYIALYNRKLLVLIYALVFINAALLALGLKDTIIIARDFAALEKVYTPNINQNNNKINNTSYASDITNIGFGDNKIKKSEQDSFDIKTDSSAFNHNAKSLQNPADNKINNTSYGDDLNIFKNDTTSTVNKIPPIFTLYRDKPNVLIIMLDRAISGFTKTVFDESPVLKDSYKGFIYYPNTVSFGFYTLQGAPALYGGYEYTPRAINRRKNMALVDKHNEALAVLPRLFAQNNWDSTITDAPWASYSWISDMSYMKKYAEHINTLHTLRVYKDYWCKKNGQMMQDVQSTLLKRNFLWYAIMCDLPYHLRSAVYNDGDYWAAASVNSRNNMFLNSYSVLDLLSELTEIKDSGLQNNINTDTSSTNQVNELTSNTKINALSEKKSSKDTFNNKASLQTNDTIINGDTKGSFIFLTNDATHDAVKCQAPNYIPVEKVTNDGDTIFSGNEQYHGLASSLHVLGKFFDYLKECGVYDNTKIIIVSDHGRAVRTGAFKKEKKIPFMREFCNPLLLVKDFDSKDELATNNAFMTNADVPIIATYNIFDGAKNPFTKKPLFDSSNKSGGVIITSTHNWVPSQHKKNIFSIAAGDWYSVKDNIFDESNWKQVKIKK